MNNYPQVSGVTINGSEYLLSQYADYSALILGKDHTSLEQALHIFDYVSLCARLRVNLDKTEDIWVGSRIGSNTKLLPEKTFSLEFFWEIKNKLRIHFNLYKEEKLSKMMVKK